MISMQKLHSSHSYEMPLSSNTQETTEINLFWSNLNQFKSSLSKPGLWYAFLTEEYAQLFHWASGFRARIKRYGSFQYWMKLNHLCIIQSHILRSFPCTVTAFFHLTDHQERTRFQCYSLKSINTHSAQCELCKSDKPNYRRVRLWEIHKKPILSILGIRTINHLKNKPRIRN